MESDQEKRIPPLQYSPVRDRWYASANFLAALEAVRDGAEEIFYTNPTKSHSDQEEWAEIYCDVSRMIKHYGSPRPPAANEDQTNG